MKIGRNERQNRIAGYVISFIITAAVRLYTAFMAMPVFTISDEVSAISIAATVAGYDWSDVISHAGYYGIGYLFIYAPLFKMGLSAIWIYRLIVAGSSVVLGLTAVVCYRLLDIFYADMSSLKKTLIATVLGCFSFVSTYQPSMRNEEMLILVCWLITYSIFSICNARKVIKHRILIVLMCGYGLTLHSRAIIIVISVLAVSLAVRLYYKEELLGLKGSLSAIALSILTTWGLKLYQSSIWSGTARNSSVTSIVTKSAGKTSLGVNYLKAALAILAGNAYTAYAITAGLYFVSFVTIFILAVRVLKKKSTEPKNKVPLIGALWLLTGQVLTLGGLIFSWGFKVANGFESGTYDWVYGYKALTYIRYPGIFIPAFMLCGVVLFEKNAGLRVRIISISNMALVCVSALWFWLIHPYISSQKVLQFFPSALLNRGNRLIWLGTIAFFVLVGAVWQLFARNKNIMVYACVALILFTSFQRLWIFIWSEGPTERSKYNQAAAAIDMLEYVGDECDIEDIYVVDTRDVTDHQIWYLVQFGCYDKHIIPSMPDGDEYLLVTNGIIDDIDVEPYLSIENDSFYVYCTDGNIKPALDSYIEMEQ